MADLTALLYKLKQALSAQDRESVNTAIKALLYCQASLGPQWRSIAMLAYHNGEIDLSVSAADAWVRAVGGAAEARFERAALLARAGRVDDAEFAFTTLRDTRFDQVQIDYSLATLALNNGDFGRAHNLLRKITSVRPTSGAAWLALAMSGGADDQREGDRLIAAKRKIAYAALPDQVTFAYALGHVLALRQDYHAAFAAFAEGASLQRLKTPHSPSGDSANAASALAGIERLRYPTSGSGSSRAIIVTGLPRSGSTLVEQILASHSAVTGGGEVNLLRLVAQDVGGHSVAAAIMFNRKINSHDPRHVYNHLLGQRFGEHGRVVDKSLNTSRYLGLVAATMPEVPIIWVRRDPVDNAWSCYRTHFAEGAAWSLDFGDIASHFRLEDHLHKRWSEVLGNRMLTIDYAKLVDDPARWTSIILSHTGLSEQPGPYASHLTRRMVTTASNAQVRKPVNKLGLNVAAPYQEHLSRFYEHYTN